MVKVNVCDRHYYAEKKLVEATRSYILTETSGFKKVRGNLCQPHSDEASKNPKFYDRKTRKVNIDAYEEWLMGLDAPKTEATPTKAT